MRSEGARAGSPVVRAQIKHQKVKIHLKFGGGIPQAAARYEMPSSLQRGVPVHPSIPSLLTRNTAGAKLRRRLP